MNALYGGGQQVSNRFSEQQTLFKMRANETFTKSKIMQTDDAFAIVGTSLAINGEQPGRAFVQNTAKHGGTKNELVEGKPQPTNFKEISLILTFFDHISGRI